MDNKLNLRLLGMMLQSSYIMQTREKYRGQGRLLILLHLHGSLTQRELIELTGRRSATLSEQLEGMEKAGLILRRKNEQDKRNVDVELTEQGKTAAVEAIQNRQSYADELFDALPQRKKQQLAGLLDALIIPGVRRTLVAVQRRLTAYQLIYSNPRFSTCWPQNSSSFDFVC